MKPEGIPVGPIPPRFSSSQAGSPPLRSPWTAAACSAALGFAACCASAIPCCASAMSGSFTFPLHLTSTSAWTAGCLGQSGSRLHAVQATPPHPFLFQNRRCHHLGLRNHSQSHIGRSRQQTAESLKRWTGRAGLPRPAVFTSSAGGYSFSSPSHPNP